MLALAGETCTYRHMEECFSEIKTSDQASPWISSYIDFLALKSFSGFGKNIILRHFLQDSALVTAHYASAFLYLTPLPTGSLSGQLFHAEAMNLQMGVGLALFGKFSGHRLERLERGINSAGRWVVGQVGQLTPQRMYSNSFPIQELRLQGGARLLSSRLTTQAKGGEAARGRYLVPVNQGGIEVDWVASKKTLFDWPISNTPLSRVQESLGFDIESHVYLLCKNAEGRGRCVTVLDWGCGEGTALLDLAHSMHAKGIRNLRLVGLSDAYFHAWQNVYSNEVTFILDHADNLHHYLSEGEVDFIYSHYGMYYVMSSSRGIRLSSLKQYYTQLRPRLFPRAKIISCPPLHPLVYEDAGLGPEEFKRLGYEHRRVQARQEVECFEALPQAGLRQPLRPPAFVDHKSPSLDAKFRSLFPEVIWLEKNTRDAWELAQSRSDGRPLYYLHHNRGWAGSYSLQLIEFSPKREETELAKISFEVERAQMPEQATRVHLNFIGTSGVLRDCGYGSALFDLFARHFANRYPGARFTMEAVNTRIWRLMARHPSIKNARIQFPVRDIPLNWSEEFLSILESAEAGLLDSDRARLAGLDLQALARRRALSYVALVKLIHLAYEARAAEEKDFSQLEFMLLRMGRHPSARILYDQPKPGGMLLLEGTLET